jgi:dCMP deaminase
MRQSHDQYYMAIAKTVSTRSTCSRRVVGCVIIDSFNHILSTGYNGVPRGAQHCTENKCGGAFFPTGQALDSCEAIHAEVNAVAQAHSLDLHSIYVTVSPCMSCMKLILSTRCRRLVFGEIYDHKALDYWIDNGGKYELI